MGPTRMGCLVFDFQKWKVGGAIVHSPVFITPAVNGTPVYLNWS